MAQLLKKFIWTSLMVLPTAQMFVTSRKVYTNVSKLLVHGTPNSTSSYYNIASGLPP
jgi:hypothetical protein